MSGWVIQQRVKYRPTVNELVDKRRVRERTRCRCDVGRESAVKVGGRGGGGGRPCSVQRL